MLPREVVISKLSVGDKCRIESMVVCRKPKCTEIEARNCDYTVKKHQGKHTLVELRGYDGYIGKCRNTKIVLAEGY